MSYYPSDKNLPQERELRDDDRFSGSYPSPTQQKSSYQPVHVSGLPEGHPPLRQLQPIQPGMQAPIDPNRVYETIPPVSEEERLLIRSLVRDSYLRRALPLSLASSAALFFINRARKRPHSLLEHFFVGLTMLPIGFLSYGGEVRRRIAESPLNSPAMQDLRVKLGIQPAGVYTSVDGNKAGIGYMGLEKDLSRGFNPMENMSGGLSDFGPPLVREPMGVDDQQGDPNAHRGLTYEELRARNRSLIK